jgi:signal recognition particle receptor subunit alpha
MKWCFANDCDLVFVAIYLSIIHISGVDEFLAALRTEFCATYPELQNRQYDTSYDFDETYTYILDRFENSRSKSRQTQKGKASSPSADTSEAPEVDAETQRLTRIAELRQRPQKPRGKDGKTPTNSRKGKMDTKWDDTRLGAAEAAALDLSEDKAGSQVVAGSAVPQGKFWEVEADAAPATPSGMWNFLSGLVGARELTAADLAGVREQFVARLVQRNVASGIANDLVDSVVAGLEGRKLGTLHTVHQAVRSGMEEALTRVLTPKKPIDVLTGVAAAREQQRPYSIVFCGVNGVGKSTSLAKVAAFFLAQGLRVGVAACDTFRSGAIEQLKTHCRALGIPLYDKGYGRDEATVAAEGILNAKKDGLDVILIDTAGRMQGNESLMKGLAKLMNHNNPDLILFVGEALVGNDGCDQLVNFNRALANNSGKQYPRLIDGIVLTKFDTIDDKVGAAISMTYSTGQPILFVGTGQTYRDLKRPNAKLLINALLK